MSVDQPGRDPRIRQDIQARRDAYVAGRDITVVHFHAPADNQAHETGLTERRLTLQAGQVVIDDPGALEEWFTSALAPWATRIRFGDTFGPGYEYEHAMQVAGAVTTPEAYLQAVASGLADVIIEAIREKRASFDEYDAALGLGEAALRLRNIPRREWSRLLDRADASKAVLTGLVTMDMKLLRAWHASDATRRSFLVYHAVVAGRIGLR